MAGLAEGRIAWEVGDQNVSLQLSKAWKKAGVPAGVWERRTALALSGQVDLYQGDRVLMPLMRRLVETIPPWEDAPRARKGKVVAMRPRVVEPGDLEGLG